MREVRTLLYNSNSTSQSNRPRTLTLSEDVGNYDVLRIYCGFGNDGYTINELNVNTFYRTNGDGFVWTYYWGGGVAGTNGSMRYAVFKNPTSNKTQLTITAAIATYLNSDPYTCQGNNDWLPVPIYKIYGIKFV